MFTDDIDFKITHYRDIDILFFNNLLKKQPNNCYLLSMKIYYMVKNDFSKEIINREFVMLSKNSDCEKSSYFKMIQGVLSLEDKDFNKAEFFFQKSLDIGKSHNKWIYLELFYFYYKINSFKNEKLALAYLNKSICIDSDFYDGIKEKVYILIEGNNFEKALHLLDNLTYDKNMLEVLYLNGLIFYNLNQYDLAEKYYKKALDKKENYYYALLGLIFVCQSKDDDYLLEFYIKKAIEFYPRDEQINKSIASYYYIKKIKDKALFYHYNALEINTNFINYSDYIHVLIYFNEIHSAYETNLQAIELFGSNYELDFYTILIDYKLNAGINIKENFETLLLKYINGVEWLEEQKKFWIFNGIPL